MGFSQAPTLPYSKLGIVEDGDTASQAIEKDKYVIWKGKNYFAKTDILQGETFVVDTNLTEVTEGAINGFADALGASSKLFIDETNIIYSGGYGNNVDYTPNQDCYLVFQTDSSNILVLNNVTVFKA